MRTAILDHGYLETIEHWGSDERIVEAARMSTGKGFLGWGPVHRDWCTRKAAVDACVFRYGPDHDAAQAVPCSCEPGAGDEKLLRFLWQNQHATPFEMAGLIVEVQAPIMVFREWHRHRTQSYNEMSARYTPLPNVNYLPTPERCLMVGGANKQAGATGGAAALTHEAAIEWLADLARLYDEAECVYQRGLAAGIPKELARLPVPVGRYSRMRASTNLRNWLAFMTLRSDACVQGMKAQWEIRQFASVVGTQIAERFPRTWALFAEGCAK
jgi:thymidylate synthase (FAD)